MDGISLDPKEIGAISILKMRLVQDVPPSELLDPRFEILARTGQRTIDPGDPLSIEIYLTGAGNWDAAKLVYVFPKGFLEKDPSDSKGFRAIGQGRMTISIEQVSLPNGGFAIVTSAKDSFKTHLDDAGGILMFNRGYFSATREGQYPDMLPQIAAEHNVAGHAPIMIDTQVASDTPPGSYSVRVNLLEKWEGVHLVLRPSTACQIILGKTKMAGRLGGRCLLHSCDRSCRPGTSLELDLDTPIAGVSGSETIPFRDPAERSIVRSHGRGGMDPNPTCRTCGALVDLSRRNAVTPVIYRNVACGNCGVICILEGPERNVDHSPVPTSSKPVVVRV
ncbi:MAG: hypothetical protein WAN87_05095 [Thermoplasmata archaeon]